MRKGPEADSGGAQKYQSRREFLKTMGIVSAGAVLAACGVKPRTPGATSTSGAGGPDGTPTLGEPKASVTAGATEAPTRAATETEPAEQPTKKAEPSETDTAAPEFWVDSEGFVGNRRFAQRINALSNLFPGVEIKPSVDADKIFYKWLYKEIMNGRFKNTDWVKKLDPNKPWEGNWGRLEVTFPTSSSGSMFVEGHQTLVLDLSKKVKVDWQAESQVGLSTGVFMALGLSEGGLYGFSTSVNGDGEIVLVINEPRPMYWGGYDSKTKVTVLRDNLNQLMYVWLKSSFGASEARGSLSGIWNGYGRSYGVSYPILEIKAGA